jgi:SAM-dependent methyltransferase
MNLLAEQLAERSQRPGLHRFKVLADHLPAVASGAWVDLGGGAGEFSTVARGRGYEVTLVDGDPRNTVNAERLGVAAVLADLNLPLTELEDGRFDGASLIEVVEHVQMAERLVSEACRLLKPGGLLLLSTPNALWWPERLRALRGLPPEAEGYHFRFFGVAGTRALCEKAGFEITAIEFSTPAFGYNWLARHLLGRTKRKHVGVARPLAGLFAQTIYVIGRKR